MKSKKKNGIRSRGVRGVWRKAGRGGRGVKDGKKDHERNRSCWGMKNCSCNVLVVYCNEQ